MPAPVSALAVLETKLYPPRWVGGLVTRLGLVERIRSGVNGKLTVIAAPAGFGKTTLLAEWLARGATEGAPVAWVSLDPGDNEPALFWTCAVRALQGAHPDLGHAFLLALREEGAPSPAAMTALLNECTTLTTAVILVLDDYHVIETPAVHTALAFVLDHLPPNLHVVLATRTEPPLPLARMRARGELTELRTNDLRFNRDEVSTFLGTALPFTLTLDDASALEDRTEGWIAGLKLAALSIADRTDVSGFIRSFSGDHRHVTDYLVEEVLDRQPEETRRFLLATSLLDRLSAPLCDAAAGMTESQTLLDSLEKRNLFLIALDDRRGWYRYHHLFAEVLRARALREEPALVREVHRRASTWYEQNGAVSDAVRHARSADDLQRVAELLELHWPPKDRSHATRRWLDEVKSLPSALVTARPTLTMGYAWGLLNAGELEAAELRLREVEAFLQEDRSSPLAREAATARVYLAQSHGEVTLEQAHRALALVAPTDHAARATAEALLALAHWAEGNLDRAYDTFSAALGSMRQAGAEPDAVRGEFVLGDIRAMQGRLREAARIYRAGLESAIAHPNAETDELYLGLAEVHLELGRLDETRRLLLEIAAKATGAQHVANRHRWCIAMSRIAQFEGDAERALGLLDEAEASHRRDPLPVVRSVAAMKARLQLARGDVDAAARWATEQGLRSDDELSFLREYDHMTLTRLLIAQGERGDAIELLQRLRAATQAGGRLRRCIEALALEAMTHQKLGHTREALDALAMALELAEDEGHLRVFEVEGTPMRDLLRLATARGIAGAWTRRVLTGFDAPAPSLPQPAAPQLLTTRELEVLRLIAAGMRNQEIAKQLFISPATVKRHIANVYNKLEAGHRTDALRRAAALKLL